MAERDDWQDFERRCRLANLIVHTRIIEALPKLEPEQWHYMEVGLERHFQNAGEARAYAAYAADVVLSGSFFGAKTVDLRMQLDPPIAKVRIEMGSKAIGYIQGNSVHLFDD
jgi:hypothetical protein